MANQKLNFKTEKDLKEAILQEKSKGIPDFEMARNTELHLDILSDLLLKHKVLILVR
ncbi:MAG: hypothetical protein NC828_05735 [Candidatus Omnitrophica bacterium]|nr:hypothetical protein [Candidatus Omnitrophota bacterium]